MNQVLQMKNQFLHDLTKRYNELIALLSKYDCEEQDLLHFIENEKYDAVTMVKVTKELKDVRISRRVIKVELEQVKSMKDQLSNKNHEKFAKKTYKYKTDVLSNIAHRTKGMKACNHNLNTTK
jgi:hypothetical protein